MKYHFLHCIPLQESPRPEKGEGERKKNLLISLCDVPAKPHRVEAVLEASVRVAIVEAYGPDVGVAVLGTGPVILRWQCRTTAFIKQRVDLIFV